MSKQTVDLVITVYRRYDRLNKYINGLMTHEPDINIIIVDIDPITELVAPPTALVIKTSPGGYSKSVNAGLVASTADYIIWGNDDIEVNGRFVDKMIEPIISDPSTLVGITVFDRYIEGCLVAMHKSAKYRIGFLDERFTGTFEDVDYSRRATTAGYRLVKVNIPVRHVDLGSLDSHVHKSLEVYKDKWRTS